MATAPSHEPETPKPPPRLRSLLPAGESLTAAELVDEFGLWERPPSSAPGERPRVSLNMVSSVDGRATLCGRSAPLSGPGDRALFHALRAPADAILIGAGTLRAERYGRLIGADDALALRARHGLPQQPYACVVTTTLALGADIPLLADPTARIVILTGAPAELPAAAASVDYIRPERGTVVDLAASLIELRGRFAVEKVLCEGGPHLAAGLLAAGLVDELFLSLSPTVAGEPRTGSPLRILAGAELDPPVGLELLAVHESDSQLFLRYGVPTPARAVSRETTSSSSLAS